MYKYISSGIAIEAHHMGGNLKQLIGTFRKVSKEIIYHNCITESLKHDEDIALMPNYGISLIRNIK